MKGLESLELQLMFLNDCDLKHVSQMDGLAHLVLDVECIATGAGLRLLVGLKGLKTLTLSNLPPHSDAAMAEVVRGLACHTQLTLTERL
jgi:hypothetical protein